MVLYPELYELNIILLITCIFYTLYDKDDILDDILYMGGKNT